MNDVWLPLLLRCLPAIAVLVLGIIAGGDRRTREQWTTLLYQAGSLKPAQRDDPKIQSRVRIPFFIVAALLLIWPVKYYFWATRTIEIGAGSDLFQKTPQLESNKAVNAANANSANAISNATSSAANSSTNNSANAPAPAPASPAPANPVGPHL